MQRFMKMMSDDDIFEEYVRSRRLAIESSLDFLIFYMKVKVTELAETFGGEDNGAK